jgi:hypothetical protein
MISSSSVAVRQDGIGNRMLRSKKEISIRVTPIAVLLRLDRDIEVFVVFFRIATLECSRPRYAQI